MHNSVSDFVCEVTMTYSQRNIVLLGLSGAGKSALGYHLAQDLGKTCFDCDEWIENICHCSIAEIFQSYGEQYFRLLESRVLQSLRHIHNCVIVPGAGALDQSGNWKLIQNLGYLIWLDTPATDIAHRLISQPKQLQKRPLLADLLSVPLERKYELVVQRLRKQRTCRYAYLSRAALHYRSSCEDVHTISKNIHRALDHQEQSIYDPKICI